MSKNYLQVDLGGQLRGLKFNNRTINFIAELTNTDPFTYVPPESDTNAYYYKNLVEYAKVIVHASLLANCASKKAEPDFTSADVSEWMEEASPEIVFSVTKIYSDFMNPKISLEAIGGDGGNTQEKAAEVARA